MKIKRIFAAALAACLTLALALPASAAGNAASLDEAVQAVTALGIVTDTGNLSAKVTRAEFVTMAVKATPGGDGVGQAASSPYPDVPYSHWAAPYVEAAVAAGYVNGYLDGTFHPDEEITLAQALTAGNEAAARLKP